MVSIVFDHPPFAFAHVNPHQFFYVFFLAMKRGRHASAAVRFRDSPATVRHLEFPEPHHPRNCRSERAERLPAQGGQCEAASLLTYPFLRIRCQKRAAQSLTGVRSARKHIDQLQSINEAVRGSRDFFVNVWPRLSLVRPSKVRTAASLSIETIRL